MSSNSRPRTGAGDALPENGSGASPAPESAHLLFAQGFTQGILDALALMHAFEGLESGFRTRILLDRGIIPEVSPVASEYLGDPKTMGSRDCTATSPGIEAATVCACFSTAGYSSGWYSTWFGKTVLLQEIRCTQGGDPSCRFEARPAAAWSGNWASEILPELDPAALVEHAREEFEAVTKASNTLLPAEVLDPDSAIVQLVGSIMVLPYGGAVDAEIALEEIVADLGEGHVSVVVLDLTGTRIEAMEAAGIAQLLATFADASLEVILVGLSTESVQRLRGYGIQLPTLVPSLGDGLAAGFRFARGLQSSH